MSAARLWGQAEALREQIAVLLSEHECELHDSHVANAQAYLGAERSEQAWGEGRQMSPQDAVAYALEAGNQ